MSVIQLLHACKKGNLEKVKYLVEENKTNICAIGKFSTNAISTACKFNNYEVLVYLVEKTEDHIGKYVTSYAKYGLLYLASFHHDGKIFSYLIENTHLKEYLKEYLTSEEEDINWFSPSINAIKNDNLTVVKYLHKNGHDFDRIIKTPNCSYTECSMIDFSYERKSIEVYKYLLMSCLNFDKIYNKTNTRILNFACVMKMKECVEFILKNGFILNEKMEQISELIYDIIKPKNKSPKEMKIHHGILYAEKNPLHCAVIGNSIEIVKILIENGCDIYQKDGFNFTPFKYAVYFNRHEIKKLLIYHKAV
jgi:ankyrin repeat protein